MRQIYRQNRHRQTKEEEVIYTESKEKERRCKSCHNLSHRHSL